MRCDPSRTSVLVNEIRFVAESLRAYGTAGTARGLAVTAPTGLHLIAAHIESEMRGWVHVDEAIAGSFAATSTKPGPALRTIEFPELTAIPTLVAPYALSVEVQVAELRTGAARLSGVREALRAALHSSAVVRYEELLAHKVGDILAFADAIA